MRMRTWRAQLGVLLAVALVAVACGNGGGQTTDPTEPSTDPTTDAPDDPGDVDDFSDVEPVHLRLATLLGPGGAVMGPMEWYIEELAARTGGVITAEIAYAGSLLPGPEIMPGIQEGRAEGGLVVPAYYPTDLPLWNLIMVPVQGHNQGARPRAMHTLLENNADLQAETEAQGIKILGITPNTQQTAALTKAVTSVAEYQGMRLRVPGLPAVGYRLIDVEPVFLSAEEVYESLQRGIVDGATFPFDVVWGTGTYEVAKYLVDDGLGESGMATFGISLDLYNSLPQKVRDLMTELTEEWYDRLDQVLMDADEAACDAFLDGGNEFIIFSDEEKKIMADATGEAMFGAWRESATGAGVDGATVDAVWAEYDGYVQQFNAETSYRGGLAVCAERAG
jgi:TRAP-type transport system periplasmic protein